mmetsp:Transcript_34097/g.86283  ORF Transcript_34097/g.86283 Transcript_34097/m.86283 type:complete len:86 (+) Transcript_34097:212-469(+)|eukprot:CAMPEP_0202857742 /NCGR_PEP_ID=MMETSP1391-20130828/559_1 /ASSEMBLY_ACC=CAM_ASM_000867 /TAXON_ID=1034604 /ORGANISM="Chlamydomonas leiostraca, Strain SAG 11-49" /LENGTH=85 /DNA_ID=CAMNT_0049536583 /DNA_START=266 /DNA_END=523 /DNA_ORIENTATION=+
MPCAFTTASRVLQEASTFSSEQLIVLSHTFVKYSHVLGIITLATGVNQYLISMQLDMQKLQMGQHLSNIDDKLKRIEEQMGQAKK